MSKLLEVFGITEHRLTEAILEGCNRVSSIIDGNSQFSALIEHKTVGLDELFAQSKPISELRGEAIAYTMSMVKGMKAVSYIIPDCDILLCGKTKNNIREFDFFRSKLGRADLTFANIADHVPVKDAAAGTFIPLFADVAAVAMKEFYQSRHSISAGLVYQVAKFVVQLGRYLLSMRRSESHKPSLVVVANDHSPNQVAFSISYGTAAFPRLYIQHAEVSTAFPPLHFEFSILRNQVSQEIYEAVAHEYGRKFVISRYDSDAILPAPPKSFGNAIDVVVYTTSRVESQGLSAVIDGLLKNEAVAGVFIKPHPNQPVTSWPSGVQIIQQALERPHIAIVANSSVAVELLHKGIPVFQNFDFDPVPPDYYGFVSAGLTYEVGIDSMTTRFWDSATYDADWAAKFSSYSPSLAVSKKNIARLRASLRPIIGPTPARHEPILPAPKKWLRALARRYIHASEVR